MCDSPKVNIVVRAFFQMGGGMYRQYGIDEAVNISDIEILIRRARGRANLLQKFYMITRGMTPVLDTVLLENIEWNFHKFFYQIGVVEYESSIMPDGFLLACRNSINGDVEDYFVAKELNYMARLEGLFGKRVGQYENIFLGELLTSELMEIFGGSRITVDRPFFFELTPFLRSHNSYYRSEYGIEVLICGTP